MEKRRRKGKELKKLPQLKINKIDNYYVIAKNLDEFRVEIAIQLLTICVDIFFLDKAMEIFDYMSEYILTNDKYKSYFIEYHYFVLDPFAVRLYKSGEIKQASKILKVYKGAIERLIKDGQTIGISVRSP